MLEGGDGDSMLDSAWASCSNMQNWPGLLSPPYHTHTPKNRFPNSVFRGSKSEYLSMVETLEPSRNWHLGFPNGTSGKELTRQCRRREMRVPSLGKEDPLEKEMTTHSNILTLDSEAWWAPCLWGHEESDTTEVTEHAQNQNLIIQEIIIHFCDLKHPLPASFTNFGSYFI